MDKDGKAKLNTYSQIENIFDNYTSVYDKDKFAIEAIDKFKEDFQNLRALLQLKMLLMTGCRMKR
ncbi:hypothetical protein L3073_17145 [Ancylomarina sp. DW003]|nr:hypothetical protein [Ancylomarina sp. DW003]MDE5423943.1 hypothetical protein [Ancylomarina sp. DW003]